MTLCPISIFLIAIADATEEFAKVSHSERATKLVEEYLIGEVIPSTKVTKPETPTVRKETEPDTVDGVDSVDSIKTDEIANNVTNATAAISTISPKTVAIPTPEMKESATTSDANQETSITSSNPYIDANLADALQQYNPEMNKQFEKQHAVPQSNSKHKVEADSVRTVPKEALIALPAISTSEVKEEMRIKEEQSKHEDQVSPQVDKHSCNLDSNPLDSPNGVVSIDSLPTDEIAESGLTVKDEQKIDDNAPPIPISVLPNSQSPVSNIVLSATATVSVSKSNSKLDSKGDVHQDQDMKEIIKNISKEIGDPIKLNEINKGNEVERSQIVEEEEKADIVTHIITTPGHNNDNIQADIHPPFNDDRQMDSGPESDDSISTDQMIDHVEDPVAVFSSNGNSSEYESQSSGTPDGSRVVAVICSPNKSAYSMTIPLQISDDGVHPELPSLATTLKQNEAMKPQHDVEEMVRGLSEEIGDPIRPNQEGMNGINRMNQVQMVDEVKLSKRAVAPAVVPVIAPIPVPNVAVEVDKSAADCNEMEENPKSPERTGKIETKETKKVSPNREQRRTSRKRESREQSNQKRKSEGERNQNMNQEQPQKEDMKEAIRSISEDFGDPIKPNEVQISEIEEELQDQNEEEKGIEHNEPNTVQRGDTNASSHAYIAESYGDIPMPSGSLTPLDDNENDSGDEVDNIERSLSTEDRDRKGLAPNNRRSTLFKNDWIYKRRICGNVMPLVVCIRANNHFFVEKEGGHFTATARQRNLKYAFTLIPDENQDDMFRIVHIESSRYLTVRQQGSWWTLHAVDAEDFNKIDREALTFSIIKISNEGDVSTRVTVGWKGKFLTLKELDETMGNTMASSPVKPTEIQKKAPPKQHHGMALLQQQLSDLDDEFMSQQSGQSGQSGDESGKLAAAKPTGTQTLGVPAAPTMNEMRARSLMALDGRDKVLVFEDAHTENVDVQV